MSGALTATSGAPRFSPATPTTSARSSPPSPSWFQRSQPSRRCARSSGANSVLTANGERHLRQRKLLLPPFHGEAIERYAEMIAARAEREIDRWPIGEPFALAPRMQAITLDVIMAGIFGIEGARAPGTPEHRLRFTIKQPASAASTSAARAARRADQPRSGRAGRADAPRGMALLDRAIYPVIAERRGADDLEERRDILSLLLAARDRGGRGA